jgi:hypothetical protein
MRKKAKFLTKCIFHIAKCKNCLYKKTGNCTLLG